MFFNLWLVNGCFNLFQCFADLLTRSKINLSGYRLRDQILYVWICLMHR
eukprot:UN11300